MKLAMQRPGNTRCPFHCPFGRTPLSNFRPFAFGVVAITPPRPSFYHNSFAMSSIWCGKFAPSDLGGKVAFFQAFGLVFGGGRWPMAAASMGFVDMPSCSGAATPGRDGDQRNTCYTNALRSNGPQACPSTRHKLSSRPWRKLATLVRRISRHAPVGLAGVRGDVRR